MEEKAQVKDLKERSIGSLMLKFYFPAFAGVVVNSLYNIVDRIFIGQGVGALALAGLSVVFPIMIIYMAFGMLVGSGAAVRISINLGRKDIVRAEKVLGNAVTLAIILGIVVSALGFLIKKPVLYFFGAGPETFMYANQYLDIILLGAPFGMLGYSMNHMIRSEGNPRVAMYSMFISAGLNLVLDPIFIFYFEMGVRGAALATVISQIVLCIWVILHFRGKRNVIRLRLANLAPVMEIIIYIVTIGFASFAMQIAASLVQGIYTRQLILFGGDIAVGAMGIINSVTIMLVMAIVALNMASQPIVGFNYGARSYDRVLQTVKLGIKAATIIAVGGWSLCMFIPEQIVGLFNSDNPELRIIGVNGLRIYSALLPLVGFQIIASNLFQSIGKAKLAAFLSLLRQVIYLIPLLAVLPQFYGLAGVWLAMPVSDFLASITSFIFLRREMKRLSVKKEKCVRKVKVPVEEIPVLPESF
ncbi:MAG: MATE family efflux transporter [Bacteroidales bacterium]|nr:MATE family efflux transporter [Bacteroidales bacterium]